MSAETEVTTQARRFYEAIHGVYFDDLDALQILHNARYLLLFERTIGSFWTRVMGWGGLLGKQEEPDRFHLVRTNEIEYLHPVTGIGEVRVRIWVEKLGRTSLTFGFRVLPMDADVDYARGRRVIVRIDPQSRAPVPWTPEFRERLRPYRDAEPGENEKK
jgi:acyl-CoA thioester hydrolase